MTEYGNILAWNISNWNRSIINGTEIKRDSAMILGGSDGSHVLIIDSPMNFDTINGLCNRIGPGVRIKPYFFLIFILSSSIEILHYKSTVIFFLNSSYVRVMTIMH
jgi:hypothetical protein